MEGERLTKMPEKIGKAGLTVGQPSEREDRQAFGSRRPGGVALNVGK